MNGRQKHDGAVDPKSVAPYATLFPRIDLLRRFVSDCFFVSFLFTCRTQDDTTLSHPGCDNVQQDVAFICYDGLSLNQQ